MKAFLSHSSKDKGFVEGVASLLRPGTYELDSQTFDSGLINSQAIVEALKRSDMFCLFLSKNSLSSSYVDFETLLGIEFLAKGKIQKFLAICLDQDSFEQASANVKFFNIVRKGATQESTARLIQGSLISASRIGEETAHPFIGREDDLISLERQVNDHHRPPSRALYVSGHFGSGRRTLVRKFYENQYPKVGNIFPTIEIGAFSGLEELYRKLTVGLRPTLAAKELRIRIQSFQVASPDEKRRMVAEVLNSLLAANEAAFLVDTGGIVADSGQLEAEINEVVGRLQPQPHPPAIIIAPRMIPLKYRRREDDISYLALKSLGRDASKRLISRLVKDLGIMIDDKQLDALASLSDGHPFNYYRILSEITEKGVDLFLANPTDFLDWKHRQSSEYLRKITLNEDDTRILGLLKILPEIDFEAIIGGLSIEEARASETLVRLTNLHVLESFGEIFFVSPALRMAVERDNRIGLSKDEKKNAIGKLASSLSFRIEEGEAPIALIDAAVLSELESGNEMSGFAAAFLLPSHFVWLSKKKYDQRDFEESIRLAKEALKSPQRLSSSGLVGACRYLC